MIKLLRRMKWRLIGIGAEHYANKYSQMSDQSLADSRQWQKVANECEDPVIKLGFLELARASSEAASRQAHNGLQMTRSARVAARMLRD